MEANKCHECYVVEVRGGMRWVSEHDNVSRIMFHCPVCGRRLSFADDGTPVVGASYDELERKAEACIDTSALAHSLRELAQQYGGDPEVYHGKADELLLNALGKEVEDAFNSAPTWYA